MTSSEPARGADTRRSRRRLLYAGLVLAVIGIVIVLVWFQPQTLLFDTVVEEDLPSMQGAGDPSDGAADDVDRSEGEATGDAAAGQEPPPVATGSFTSRSRYTVSGTTAVYELQDGSRVLRLEDFESTNGPDLFVYLTAAGEAESDESLNADFVDLGRLKGNIGDQNYELPADVDLGTYGTVVIWCKRFSVGFGAADLDIG